MTEIAPPRGRVRGLNARELWRRRELAYFFAVREIKLRYRQTFFGVAWALLQPLLAAAVFALLIGKAVGVPSEGFPYLLYVYAGLLGWQLFATGMQAAATVLVEDRDLVTRVYFPRLLAPLGGVLPSLVDLAVGLLVLAGLQIGYGVGPDLALLSLPLWIFAAVALAIGAGSLLCALNVQYRDVRHTLPFMIQIWFFATPIIFPSSLVEGGARTVLALNPLTGVIDGWRWALLDAPPPPLADLASLASGIALVIVGIIYFRSTEARFADVI